MLDRESDLGLHKETLKIKVCMLLAPHRISSTLVRTIMESIKCYQFKNLIGSIWLFYLLDSQYFSIYFT